MKQSKKGLMYKQDRNAQIIAYIFFTVISLCCFLPVILMGIASFTDSKVLTSNGYSFFPEKLSLDAYKFLWLQGRSIIRSMGLSVILTSVGTSLGLLCTMMLAYPLSRPELPGRRGMQFFVFFTMLFNGGMVPTYFMYVNYFHMKNTFLGLLIPHLLVNGFNVMMVKSFFYTNIPSALIEAARIDGAGELRTFFQIVVPMATPILVTVGLLIGINYWNDWYNGILFATKQEYFSLQNFLYKIMMDLKFLSTNASATSDASSIIARLPSNSVRMAMAFVGTLPIIIIFPFVQKFFARGLTLGSMKE